MKRGEYIEVSVALTGNIAREIDEHMKLHRGGLLQEWLKSPERRRSMVAVDDFVRRFDAERRSEGP